MNENKRIDSSATADTHEGPDEDVDRAVEAILNEADEKVWRGLEQRVHAAISERDRKKAALLREQVVRVRAAVEDSEGKYGFVLACEMFANILEAD